MKTNGWTMRPIVPCCLLIRKSFLCFLLIAISFHFWNFSILLKFLRWKIWTNSFIFYKSCKIIATAIFRRLSVFPILIWLIHLTLVSPGSLTSNHTYYSEKIAHTNHMIQFESYKKLFWIVDKWWMIDIYSSKIF